MSIKKAQEFAIRAHESQVRKYTGEPYWRHCEEVASLLTDSGYDEEVIIAGWLHDTVEDTEVTFQQIKEEFGERVMDLVYWVTDDKINSNRATRKLIARNKIGNAPYDARAIKLADLISNSKSIAQHDPDFAKVYMKEKQLLLLELNGMKFTLLHDMAEKILEDYFEKLKTPSEDL